MAIGMRATATVGRVCLLIVDEVMQELRFAVL